MSPQLSVKNAGQCISPPTFILSTRRPTKDACTLHAPRLRSGCVRSGPAAGAARAARMRPRGSIAATVRRAVPERTLRALRHDCPVGTCGEGRCGSMPGCCACRRWPTMAFGKGAAPQRQVCHRPRPTQLGCPPDRAQARQKKADNTLKHIWGPGSAVPGKAGPRYILAPSAFTRLRAATRALKNTYKATYRVTVPSRRRPRVKHASSRHAHR